MSGGYFIAVAQKQNRCSKHFNNKPKRCFSRGFRVYSDSQFSMWCLPCLCIRSTSDHAAVNVCAVFAQNSHLYIGTYFFKNSFLPAWRRAVNVVLHLTLFCGHNQNLIVWSISTFDPKPNPIGLFFSKVFVLDTNEFFSKYGHSSFL